MLKNFKVKGFLVTLIIGVASMSVLGQEPASCRIGPTTFACPKGFDSLPDIDANTRLFRLKETKTPLFLVVAVPSGEFIDSNLKAALEKYFSDSQGSIFQWKAVKNPLTMELHTKYEKSFSASFGLRDTHLLELKSFVFSVKGKKVLIGYVYDWGEEPMMNKRLFEKGEGLGDTAVGCNAVVTLLNSITKEFKEMNQYCTLSGLSRQ